MADKEINYILNALAQDKKNIDDVLLFFKKILPNFSIKEKAVVPEDNDAFSWICYVLSFLDDTSKNLDELINLFQSKK